MAIHTYIPQDRLRAITMGVSLPDRTSGSALFADISGFTALTEALQNVYGARRGSEELSKHLETVYSALITEIETFGGSVISFAGDSMLCWFDEAHGSAAPRATACAFAMQAVMKSFDATRVGDNSVALTLKVTVASGPARRFTIGDPEIKKLDALAGRTVTRTSTAEHHAQKREVLLDEASVSALGDWLTIQEWRTDEDTQERFAVATRFNGTDTSPSILKLQPMPPPNTLMSWIHQAVFEREEYEQGAFLTEFRPCAALFVRFTGIDYESDSAETELDGFICEMQRAISRHEGTLMEITIGDKGSYAYVNFGALSMHEDDSRRAVKTAWELMKASSLQLQMGITQGLMRVGAYGGPTRKQFGALGDDVNLAARLMMTAKMGEILVSGHAHKAAADQFTFEPRSPLPMKGKAEPLPVFAVTGESHKRAIRLQEPNYALPMVGRTQELQIINHKLDLAAEGKSQIIGIVAEAGMGKSRLVAEVIRSARKKGFVGYGGACQSDAIHTPYQAWKSIWQAFFDVDHEQPLRKQMRNLEGEIEDRASSRVEAMPLLNVVLDLNIPENDFTQNLEPKIRQSALHALLEDCLKAAAASTNGETNPLLVVIEDLHWIDALSHDLLEGLAKALANYPVCFALAYRPPSAVGVERLQAPRLEALAQFTQVELHELTHVEAESAIRAKLAQLYPARGGALPSGLVQTLMARAQGNPFYLEELLNYVRDRGLDPADLSKIELPDSLHTLILSRIDQLSEQEKTTLRVASIVGRLFRANWLTGYYPELGTFPTVKTSLDALESLDITPLDSPEPELSYLFKHIVTHEVTYESLPFATRARLHEQLARYLESVDASVETIAFHYGRSENQEKQHEYLRKAGEAAQKSFANDAALEHYGMLLPLLKYGKEQAEIYLKRGQVYEFIGKYDDAESDYRAALESAKDDLASKASTQYALGKLNRLRGDYAPSLEWLGQAKKVRTKLEDTAGLAQVLIETGMVLRLKAEFAQAREPLNEGLALAREAGDRLQMARAINALGLVAMNQGDYPAARAQLEKSLALRREIGDKQGIASSLLNLGNVAMETSDYAAAQAFYKESLVLRREIGEKEGIAASLHNLGIVADTQGDYAAAQALYEESLALSREMDDKLSIAMTLHNLGLVAEVQGVYTAARALYEQALALRREMGDKFSIPWSLLNLGTVAYHEGDYASARALYEESLALLRETGVERLVAYPLLSLGLVDLAENKPEARDHILHSLRRETGERLPQTSSLIGVAGLVLREGNPQFTAQLLGAVESALKALGAVVEPGLKPFHARTLAAVREQLGEAAFQPAWEEGSQWSLEEAVKKALEEQD